MLRKFAIAAVLVTLGTAIALGQNAVDTVDTKDASTPRKIIGSSRRIQCCSGLQYLGPT